MLSTKKVLILPNKGNIYTLKELEKMYYNNEKKSTSFLFQNYQKKDNSIMKIPEIMTKYINF